MPFGLLPEDPVPLLDEDDEDTDSGLDAEIESFSHNDVGPASRGVRITLPAPSARVVELSMARQLTPFAAEEADPFVQVNPDDENQELYWTREESKA